LYRQPQAGAWGEVLDEVQADLARFAGGNIFLPPQQE
jgi:hypothetical protein